jgi:hypothetical protein
VIPQLREEWSLSPSQLGFVCGALVFSLLNLGEAPIDFDNFINAVDWDHKAGYTPLKTSSMWQTNSALTVGGMQYDSYNQGLSSFF